MSTEAMAVWPVLSRLQERAQRLEKEMTALRADVEQVAQVFDRTVAVYEVNGEKVAITKTDVARVEAELLRPHSTEAIRIVALADKIGERRQHLPSEEQKRIFEENVEAIRIQAIADGTAIDDPREAAIGD